eukprot:TRINITY_DN549_c0_g1_i1.p1 TRINITY_DN549_c0_g1~~TRINITY_DN549_c0_g1_i1.p1  ORF type:complete len:147 (-),score=29.90 TRINITY_DN549_c0_g1_i1:111-521(-)
MSADYFFIVSEHNPSLVLDIEGGVANQGAKLITWAYHGGENQRFRFNPQGFIISAKSGLVLDVEGGPNQGAKIIQWPAHGGANQRWRLHKDGTIRLENSNLAIDIEGGSNQQGAKLVAWPVHGNTNQRWRIVNHWH